VNLFDMMRQAGAGDGFSALAGRFGMSEEQVTKAVEAFLPAFSAGLKRSTADPLGVAEFMRKLGSGDYSRAYTNPAFAPAAGRSGGQDALNFLFGSPDAAQAVARQAATFTGLAQEKMQELLPALAAMMFGGFGHQANAANPVFAARMEQFSAAGANEARAAKGPLDRLEEEQASQERDQMARAQQDMMQAGLAAFHSGAAAWQKAVGDMAGVVGSSGTQSGAGEGKNPFAEMFEPGRRLSETYQREMEATLRRFRPDLDRA
jgi:hypothetical protein